jgi:ATP-dependent DNA helicase RecG
MVAGRQETHVDVEAFWREFGRVEHESLEFKRSANNLREVIPAMAMAAGGRVVLGVDDGRRLVGCPLDQSTLDAVMRRAQECGVDVTVEPLVVGTVPLTLITVPEVTDRIVTTPDGRLLRRIGSDNLPLRADQVSEFVRARMSVRGRLQRRLKRTLPAWLGPGRRGAPRGSPHPAPET